MMEKPVDPTMTLLKSKDVETSKSKESLSSQAKLSEQEFSAETLTSVEISGIELTESDLEEELNLALEELNLDTVDSVALEIRRSPFRNGSELHLVNIIIKKAVDTPEYGSACAQLCKSLSTPRERKQKTISEEGHCFTVHYPNSKSANEFSAMNTQLGKERSFSFKERSFKMVLLNRCEELFKHANCKKEAESSVEAKISNSKHIAFCKFLGHLCSLNILDSTLMLKVLISLLKEDVECIEAICSILLLVARHFSKQDPIALKSFVKELRGSLIRFFFLYPTGPRLKGVLKEVEGLLQS